ncbi:MAG: glycosyl transferase family 2, partial [Terracidiphilus sp.]
MTYGNILSAALLALAVLGAATSTVYSLMVVVGVLRFRRRAAAFGVGDFLPPVSLLKPLHGNEPNLEENLASFFQQDYPHFEILFCARHASD